MVKMAMADIRKEIIQIADRHPQPDEGARLRLLAEATRRRPAVRRAPRRSRSMTDILGRQIAEYAADHPHDTMMEIARRFAVNIGRVSEALKIHGA